MPQRSPPVRLTSGFTTDPRFGPLAGYGFRNPFFWHEFEDDFDGVSANYTKTINTNGTIAAAAGDGGLALFTTNSSTPLAADIASIQLPTASFKLVAGYRAAFLIRLQLADVVNAGLNVGLIQTTTTPFTVTDGVFFNKAAGASTNLRLQSVVGSAATNVAIPAAAYTLVNATNIDLGFFVTGKGDIEAYVGTQLVGFIPQSGTGAVNASGVSLLPKVGPVARLTAPTLTAANLNLTVALQSGTTASTTMTVDFVMAAKER